jgi:8-oxo-dGTP pyrophosphatase MutT (NUDIX family)
MTFESLTHLRDYVAPLFRRPNAVQVAALCHRTGVSGPEVLLVKSSSGRWILPKGWPMEGTDGAGTALTEAWEEAGVKRGKAEKKAIGTFQTVKVLETGPDVPCTTYVYPIEVRKLADDYPEAVERERKWLPVSEARAVIDDSGLRDILDLFERRNAA